MAEHAPPLWRTRRLIGILLSVLVAGFATFLIIERQQKRWSPPSVAVSGHARIVDGGALSDDLVVRRFRDAVPENNFGVDVPGKVVVIDVEWAVEDGGSIPTECDLEVVIFAPPGWRWFSWAGEGRVVNGVGASYYWFFDDSKPAWRNPVSLSTSTRDHGAVVAIASIPEINDAASMGATVALPIFCDRLDPKGVLVTGPSLNAS